MTVNKQPYEDTAISNSKVLRRFPASTDPQDLVWQENYCDQFVIIIESGGWKFQCRDGIPVPLSSIHYRSNPRLRQHRVLKGHSDLIIRIHKRL